MRTTPKLLCVAAALALAATLAAPEHAAAQQEDEATESGGGGGGGGGRGGGRADINRPFTGQRPFQLDVHGGFTWWGVGVATGVRFGIPILQNGFIDSINNAVYINFGVDFYWVRWREVACGIGGRDRCWDYGAGVGFPVTLHWEFYLNESWSVFAELGAQFFMHPRWINNERFDVYEPGYWFVGAVGGSWHINENILLTLRLGSPYAAFGVTFQF